VSGIPGEVVNKTTIPDGYFYLGKDNPVATSTWMVPAAAIIGKPIIDLGYVDWFGTGEIVNTEVSNTVAGNLPIPPEADAQTFKILGSAGYAKDSRHVYFLQNGDPCPRNGCTAIIPQADPATFSVVPGSQYAKDKNNVYLPDQFGNVDVISSAEPKTFTFLGYTNVLADPNSSPDPFYGFYGKDKSHVFYASHLITEADTSFTFIRDAQGGFTSYARDKAHIYNAWTGTPIQDADVATFVVLGLYAKDKNHVYAYEPDSMESVFTIGKVLEGADPSTFQLVAGNSKYDAMDANHHWLNAKIAL
jgi:hypothetical protein